MTHGHLATEFRAALEHVVGPQRNLATIAIAPDDDMESRRRDIIAAVEQVETDRGVIILTDMFGGTPSNLAISVMEPGRIDVVAGVNLPMLIKLASVREEKTLDEAVTSAQDAGRKYITVASRVPVSYTHLDVYKRQRPDHRFGCRARAALPDREGRAAALDARRRHRCGDRRRALRDLPAVSYTHLDVYKRQLRELIFLI